MFDLKRAHLVASCGKAHSLFWGCVGQDLAPQLSLGMLGFEIIFPPAQSV